MRQQSVKAGNNKVRIIGGSLRRRQIVFPSIDGLRPTPDRVRETLFNWLGQELDGQRCLDLFAGSGALGFEAASRGARQVVMVELNRVAVQSLHTNQQQLAVQNVEIRQTDALLYLAGTADTFDLIMLDPPFHLDLLPKLLPQVQSKLKPDGFLYIESGMLPDLTEWQIIRQGKAGVVHHLLLKPLSHKL